MLEKRYLELVEEKYADNSMSKDELLRRYKMSFKRKPLTAVQILNKNRPSEEEMEEYIKRTTKKHKINK